MAIEYSGYVQAPQVDWSALSGKLAKSITDAGEARVSRREELDKIASDNINKINEIDQGQNQTFGTIILDFQDNGRNSINQWNQQLKAGTMTTAEYKKRTSNLSDYTGILASSAKNLDERINNAVQRQADGVASAYEIEMLKNIGSMAEIKDSKFFISDNGTVVWSKVDPATGAMVGEPKDVRTPNLPQNMVDNKVVVTDFVKEATKNWDTKQIFTDKGGGAYTNIESVKEQPFYQDMIAKVAVAATSSPRATLSILADNGVIDPVFYSTEAEKKSAINERYAEMSELNRVAGRDPAITDAQRKEVENSLVKNTIGPDGTYNPELTKDQITLAQDHVKKEVDMQMQVKMDAQGRTQYAPQRGDGGDKDEDGIAGWDMTQKIFSSTVPVGKTSGTDNNSSLLSSLASKNPGLKFKKVKWSSGVEGVAIMKYVKDSKGGKWVDFINITNPRDLAPYIYGTSNIDKSLNTWDKANNQGGGTTKQAEVPTASKADWKAAGWSDAQIAQGIKEGKIKLN